MLKQKTSQIKFSILEMEYGRSLVKIDYEEDSQEFWISNFLSCDFFDLMEVMFWMNPNLYRAALEPLRKGPRSSFQYEESTKTWQLHWDLEGEDVYLQLTQLSDLPNGDIELTIKINDSEWIKAALRYKELCYSIVKAINDIMAKQGLLGINWTNENQDLNLRHFMHLKAYVMDLGDIDQCDGFTSYSKLEDDLKLIALRMP